VLDGPVGDYFASALSAKGIQLLAWGSGGLKQLETTSRLITTPDDMKGLKIRILPFPIYAAMYQALGAIPLSIDFSETYLALQQHTVEAIDSSLDAATAANMYVVCKRCALSNHIFSVTPLFASKDKIASLPPDLQTILTEESHNAIPFWRATYAKHIGDVIALMKTNGVAFNEIEYAPFRRAVEPVYTAYRSKLGGDLLDRVTRAAAS
jgi:TRAP-type C4-dicarboxylate transport system substrate-binding protein